MTLIGYWPLNENSGDTAYDYGGNENHGAHQGSPGPSGTGLENGICGQKAYAFDGESDEVSKDTGLIDRPFTISLWVWAESGHDTMSPISTPAEDTDEARDEGRMHFYRHSDGYYYVFNQGEEDRYDINGSIVTQNESWDHVVLICGEEGRELWINGELDETDDLLAVNHRFTMIGNQDRNSDYWWDGRISEVRIYNRALSLSEIQYLYNVSKRGRFTSRKKKARKTE